MVHLYDIPLADVADWSCFLLLLLADLVALGLLLWIFVSQRHPLCVHYFLILLSILMAAIGEI